ncbi:MAG: NosD domain-containing protein [Nanoarchaeota archaeon]
MRKRGQSEVITTVLIILLVLAAVFIVYVAVRNMVQSGTEQATGSSSKFDVVLTTQKACFVSGVMNDIPVSRKAGAGDISEIRIIFKDADGGQVCDKSYTDVNDIPGELETVTYSVDLSSCPNADSFEVYPIIILGNKEVIGMKAVESGSSCAGGTKPPITGGVVEDVTGCRDIVQAGTYTLTQSIVSTGTCITITANNVILNGNSKTITYNDYGILVSGARTGITIKNFAGITGDNHGIYADSSLSNSFIQSNTITSNVFSGIVINGASSNNVIDSSSIWAGSASDCYDVYACSGIVFASSSTNDKINGNTITAPRQNLGSYGIRFQSTLTNDVINGNTINANDIGISSGGLATSNNITGNNFVYATYTGIYLSSSSGNIISGNDMGTTISGRYTEGDSIILSSSSGDKILNNIITSTNGEGIYLGTSTNSIFSGNTLDSQTYSGIIFSGASSGTVINGSNTINAGTSSCSDGSYYCSGIVFASTSANDRISGNTETTKNTITSYGHGIYFSSVPTNQITTWNTIRPNSYSSPGGFTTIYGL